MPELPPIKSQFKWGYLLTGISAGLLVIAFGFLAFHVLEDGDDTITDDSGEADRIIEVEAYQWDFDPNPIEVREGEKVRLEVDSTMEEEGSYDAHGFFIAELDINENLPVGETTIIEFEAEEPGEYEIICNVFCGAGHNDHTAQLIIHEEDSTQEISNSQQDTDNQENSNSHGHNNDNEYTNEPVENEEDTSNTEMASLDIDDISRHPTDMPESPNYQRYVNGSYEDYQSREEGETRNVEVHTTFEEVNAEVVEGSSMEYWTFDGKVPGPMFRVKEGDTIEWNLHNPEENVHPHNIAVHAVSGPGGGALHTDVGPDGTAKLDTEMLDPGVYIYHCAFPSIGEHIGKGMNGIIVVEPEEGLEEVDHEFQVLQMDFYTEEGGDQSATELQDKGHLDFSREKLFKEEPSFVAFNGRPDAITGERALGEYGSEIEPGDDVRLFFGNGGPALASSYRPAVGDKVDHFGGNFELIEENEETVIVPAGAAKMFEMSFSVPGTYPMYDHSFPRPEKGAQGEWQVSGDMEDYEDLFNSREFDSSLR